MGVPPRSLIPRGRVPPQTLLYARSPSESVANVGPTAAFSSAAGADSLSFAFTDESTDSDGTVSSWLWDFGDGQTSTLQNPSHTYAVQGSKTVTLTVTDNGGLTDDVQHSVAPLPIMPSINTVGAEVASVLGANASVPCPGTYQNNDLVYLICECLQTETITANNGYAAIADSPQTGAATKLQIFMKRLSGIVTPGSGEANTTLAGYTNHVLCVPILVRNAQATGTPENVTAGDTAASSTAVSIPGDTTTQPKCLIIAACAAGTDTITDQFGTWANASLANFGEIADAFTTDGGGGGVGVAAGELAAAGAYSATTAVLAGASSQARISFAVMGKGTV